MLYWKCLKNEIIKKLLSLVISDVAHLLNYLSFFFNLPQRPQIYQARWILVTSAFFNYHILESTKLVNSMLFDVINDIQWSQFGGNTASFAIGFEAPLVHESFEQWVRGELLPLCKGAVASALVGVNALRPDKFGGQAKIWCVDEQVLLLAASNWLLDLLWGTVALCSAAWGSPDLNFSLVFTG